MSLKSALRFPWVFNLSQNVLGAARLRRWFVEALLRPRPLDAIFEAGCGTGDLLAIMPPIGSYFGYDISREYIQAARQHYPKHRFEARTAEELLSAPPVPSDIGFCVGLLHHLDDGQVRAVLELAARNMKPGARFVALEPCFLRHQTRLSRWIISKDRGQFVRQPSGYRKLFDERFGVVCDDTVTGLNNIPYVHVAIEASSPRA